MSCEDVFFAALDAVRTVGGRSLGLTSWDNLSDGSDSGNADAPP